MGLHYTFHVEVKTEDAWHVPPSLGLRSEWSRAGEFLWQSGRRRSMDLFFGRYALFPFAETIPPHWETSELYAYFAEFYSFEENDWYISWISYEDLFVDDWHSELVLVSGRVGVEHAHHFGDGTSAFPEATLLEAGMPLREVEDLRCSNLIEEPLNWCYGKRRHALADAELGTRVPVSWRDTVWNYLGDEAASSFLSLRRFGDDAHLRVISTRS